MLLGKDIERFRKEKNLEKKLSSFRLSMRVIKMLDALSKSYKLTKTDIVSMLIEDFFKTKNRIKLK